MSILWCGGEDIDFPNGAGIAIRTDGGGFRSGYGRCAVAHPWLSNAYSKPFAGGGVTSCWLHFYGSYGWDQGNANNFIGLIKGGVAQKGIYIGAENTNWPKLRKWNGATWGELGTSGLRTLGGNVQVDLEMINYGANGTLNLYTNGTLVLTYTGDISVGESDLDSVVVAWTAGSFYTSEIIVADQDTRTLSLVTHAPSAAGDANQWSGAYTDIDETAKDDADLIYVNTDAQDAQFNVNDLPAGTFSIYATKIVARASKSAASTVGHLKLGVKSNGTVDVDAGQDLTTGWATLERLTATINGAALTPALVNDIQLNLRSAT